jgi:uncharacterized surface protein with fasciclin (FAS1) repeats
MKKAFYGAFVVLLLGGAGIGFWLLRQGEQPPDQTQTIATEQDVDIPSSSKSLSEVLVGLSEHKEFVDLIAPTLPESGSMANTIVFVPTVAARQKFVTDTALSLSKYSNYHVVVSDVEIQISDGVRLKTKHGQELLVVKKDNQLFVRDAKGNDSRLRKPLVTTDGKIYYIDNVLLTQ